jgi:hypothetical protein
MTMKIEDYALIGDTHTAALVSREGSFGLVDAYALPEQKEDARRGHDADRRYGGSLDDIDIRPTTKHSGRPI